MDMDASTARHSRRRRLLLLALAIVFAAWTVLYATAWMIAVRPAVSVELGFDAPTFFQAEHALVVENVRAGSPAEKAGMRPGDRIVAIDGEPLRNANSQVEAWGRHRVGDTVRLTIVRPGHAAPLQLVGVFRQASSSGLVGGAGYLADALHNWYPVPFVVIGLTVLFLRVEDRNTWLLALLFASFTTTASSPSGFDAMPAFVRSVALAYGALFLGLVGPLFYWFFAVFPARSPFDRRLPWLKWLAAALGLCLAVPGVGRGQLQLPAPVAAALHDPGSNVVPFWYEFSWLMLGVSSLAVNFVSHRDHETRRRIRVIFWGTTVAIVPPLGRMAAQNAFRFVAPAWLNTLNAALIFLFPLSFAYAVVKHRVLEIPVLLRRSARYLLVQRGFALSLSLISIAVTLLFAFSFAARLEPIVDVKGASGIVLGAVFGTVVLWGGLRVHRQVSERIDRAFFRRAYDARVILEDLAQQTPSARDRAELAALLEHHLREALKPEALIVYLRDQRLVAMAGDTPAGLETLTPDLPLLCDLADRGQPWEVPPARPDRGGPVPELGALNAECLVPILGRDKRLSGLIVLGPRLSEEPYSAEDKRLLASVAGQAGIALDNIRFAEELAERIETERRIAHEMDIARDVQARLLPQAPPPMDTVECAARCVQARSVGGDYYDFLDLGDRRAGFVLADVSGKGVHAALLSASLQAHLRSQALVAPLDPARLLTRLNGIIWMSTAAQHYATLFFGVYDDRTRRMRYVNCGHNPPMVVRADGTIQRLAPTAPVVGLFEEWRCSAREIQLSPEDLLAVFSDGITDALNGDQEYGETRLAECLKAGRDGTAGEIVSRVLASVQAFNAGEQFDDLTLLVVKAR